MEDKIFCWTSKLKTRCPSVQNHLGDKYLAILCISAFLTYFLKLKLVWAKCIPCYHENLESFWPRVPFCFVRSGSLCSAASHLFLCILLLPLTLPRFLLCVCLFSSNPLRPPATLQTSPSLKYLTFLTVTLLKHSLRFQWGKNFSSTAKDTPQIILCFCDVFYKQCMGQIVLCLIKELRSSHIMH